MRIDRIDNRQAGPIKSRKAAAFVTGAFFVAVVVLMAITPKKPDAKPVVRFRTFVDDILGKDGR